MLRIIFAALTALLLTACGGSSSSSSNLVIISGIGATTTINQSGAFDLTISGIRNNVIIPSGSSVTSMDLSGNDNIVTIQPNVTVGSIDASGIGNTLYVPAGSGITFRSDSGINNVIIQQ
jgi:hypothetical protein